ncbi:hypothetical protein [Pukyongia salina]|uniref:hypothetical protein n=1 Tax=Pukyongia salina TaxID=2094025 RepID=UPI00143C9D36|nr:hypothetical protein [Pukyongia salina]
MKRIPYIFLTLLLAGALFSCTPEQVSQSAQPYGCCDDDGPIPPPPPPPPPPPGGD